MRCNKCGEKLRTGDSYCPICGTKYAKYVKPTPKSNKVYTAFGGRTGIMLCLFLVGSSLPGCVGMGYVGWFLTKSIAVAAIVCLISSIPFVVLFMICFDSLEIVNGDTIKISRWLGLRRAQYRISNIDFITDDDPYKVGGREDGRRQRFRAYSKDGRLLFTTSNSYDVYTLFNHYNIRLIIYHGLSTKQ